MMDSEFESLSESLVLGLKNVSATPQARERLRENGLDPDSRIGIQRLLLRHTTGDYGQVKDPEQVWANDLAMFHQEGVVQSYYELPDGRLIVVQTRFNQPVTTIYVPEEDD